VTIQPPEPYIPFAPLQGGMRALYNSLVQVTRLTTTITDFGAGSLSWSPITDVCDKFLNTPGYLMCRIDVQFVRRGVDQPAPIVAGKAPDRTGVLYYDPVVDYATGVPVILSGDRLVCVSGPIMGTWEVRQIPDVAQDVLGAHHVETQVIEVAQSLQQGSRQPFPGSVP
jgi:hypothetical protein